MALWGDRDPDETGPPPSTPPPHRAGTIAGKAQVAGAFQVIRSPPRSSPTHRAPDDIDDQLVKFAPALTHCPAPVHPVGELSVGTSLHETPRELLLSRSHQPLKFDGPVPSRDHGDVESVAAALAQSQGAAGADVIGPAESMKELFKMPYSNKRVSLAVHKIGSSLVIGGELDIRPAQPMDAAPQADQVPTLVDDDGEAEAEAEAAAIGWNVAVIDSSGVVQGIARKHGHGKPLSPLRDEPGKPQGGDAAGVLAVSIPAPRKKNPAKVQEKQLYSRFIYQSLEKVATPAVAAAIATNDKPRVHSDTSSDLPAPPKEYASTFTWKLRDLSLLVGSDLLVVNKEIAVEHGRPMHSSVSLRLRDADAPISTSTALDFWLDNVMANVPGLAVCYHRAGYVQGYQLLRTADIPQGLSASPFKPQVVESHAAQVLQFLQSHCTRDVGTYWLFRESGDEALQLFDLTSMWSLDQPFDTSTASARMVGRGGPFAFPLAMLCYRMGSSLLKEGSSEKRSKAQALLNHCLELIDADRHPGVCAAAHEQLAYCHIAPNTTRLLLEDGDNGNETFGAAIGHLLAAARVLQAAPDAKGDALTADRRSEQLTRILRRAANVASLRAESEGAVGNPGAMLAWLETAARLAASRPDLDGDDQRRLLELWGDAHVKMVHTMNPESVVEQQQILDHDRASIQGALLGVGGGGMAGGVSSVLRADESLSSDPVENASQAVHAYILALSHKQDDSLSRKLGNAHNELGVLYLQRGRFTRAAEQFSQGIAAFQRIDDSSNSALLYLNMAKISRILASTDSEPGHRNGLSPMQRAHYKKALQCYEHASELNGVQANVAKSVQRETAAALMLFGKGLAAQLESKDDARDSVEAFRRSAAIFESLGEGARASSSHSHLGHVLGMEAVRMIRQGDAKTAKTRLALAENHFAKALIKATPVVFAQTMIAHAAVLEAWGVVVSDVAALKQALRRLVKTRAAFRDAESDEMKELREQVQGSVRHVLKSGLTLMQKRTKGVDGWKSAYRVALTKQWPDVLDELDIDGL